MKKKKISAIHIPHHKNTGNMDSIRVNPSEVLISLKQASGSPSVVCVEVGQHVKVGQVIATEGERNSTPVHASVSGVVKAIEPFEKTMAVRIESDGLMEVSETVVPPTVTNLEEFLAACKASGVVGLGGAAFPLWGKLDAIRRGKIKTVLVNGAECEPYCTSDHRTMMEDTDYVVKGVEYLAKYLNSEEFIIGIENNKPDCIEKLTKAFANNKAVTVKPLDAKYPQGAKQVLLLNATGKVVEAGQRLATLETIIINVTSLACMARFMETGMPLVERVVTVDGSAVAKPGVFKAPIGTSMAFLFEAAGGFSKPVGKLINGGPMMGHTVTSLDTPTLKASGCVLAFDEEMAKMTAPSACIHCGKCVEACPLGLDPTIYARAMALDDDQKKLAILTKYEVNICMQCGCCSYVCPANRPLVATNIEAINFVRANSRRK